jgi:RimJ/RimL family protein N-acetyltransferase
VDDVALEELPLIDQFCREHDVKLLIARTPTIGIHAAQAMEEDGYRLMDTLVYYSKPLKDRPLVELDGDVTPRPIQLGEEEGVKQVAETAFRGYSGHYHADQRLPREQCDQVYPSWAYNLCIDKSEDLEVFVVDSQSEITGFGAFRMNNPAEGEGVLFGVSPTFQRRGIYRSILIAGINWCIQSGADRVVSSTQITNIASQRAWIGLGFEPTKAYYTFHKWFDS